MVSNATELVFLSSAQPRLRLILCDFFHALVRLALFWTHKGLRGLDYFSATDMINGLLSNRGSSFLCVIHLSGKGACSREAGFVLPEGARVKLV